MVFIKPREGDMNRIGASGLVDIQSVPEKLSLNRATRGIVYNNKCTYHRLLRKVRAYSYATLVNLLAS